MTPEELKWWQFQENLKHIRAAIEMKNWNPYGGMLDPKKDTTFRKFMAKVLKPLTKSDL